jgi:hypothetical protein
MRTTVLLACLALVLPAQMYIMPHCAAPSAPALKVYESAFRHHEKRRLEDASLAYAEALKLAPPLDPVPGQATRIRKFAPRLFTTASEPFPLIDFAAIQHPALPWIAYHLFWEDDIDFPDDNDPCDHEVIWVKTDAAGRRLETYITYFHRQLVSASPPAIDDANRRGGRPAVLVQWGKHGSMPLDWEKLKSANMADFERLSTKGRYQQESPLGRRWPRLFRGSFEDFLRFPLPVDPLPLLERNRMEKVAHFNNAVINRHFLRYNFAAKTDWPEAVCAGAK